ncbi:hypothetical protein [Alteromonas antoniana]|uniref:hypothetical protein n=1 Tax=Alteromonas antoniana TaxID=2803813 RepID=UPI003083F3FD
MARLSQRAFNNVVIFAMLLMIALFNLDSFLPVSQPQGSQPLLTSDAYILKIEQDQQRLERTGQHWRYVTETVVDMAPEAQIEAWQSGILEPAPRARSLAQNLRPIIAVVWLAGESQGLVYAFYMSDSHTFVKHNDQWFELERVTLKSLLPWFTFKEVSVN